MIYYIRVYPTTEDYQRPGSGQMGAPRSLSALDESILKVLELNADGSIVSGCAALEELRQAWLSEQGVPQSVHVETGCG